jgi:hypothetical protein
MILKVFVHFVLLFSQNIHHNEIKSNFMLHQYINFLVYNFFIDFLQKELSLITMFL